MKRFWYILLILVSIGVANFYPDHHDGDTTKMFMGWRNIEDLYKQV